MRTTWSMNPAKTFWIKDSTPLDTFPTSTKLSLRKSTPNSPRWPQNTQNLKLWPKQGANRMRLNFPTESKFWKMNLECLWWPLMQSRLSFSFSSSGGLKINRLSIVKSMLIRQLKWMISVCASQICHPISSIRAKNPFSKVNYGLIYKRSSSMSS